MAKKAKASMKKGGRKKGGANRQKGPRSVALPGMGQVTNQRLNNVCEALGEIRDSRAQLDQDEASVKQRGLDEMHKAGAKAYVHKGIELSIRSKEVLSVRRTKNEASASGELIEPEEAVADEEETA